MTRRVQGGTAGLLAALASGRLDPLCAELPEDMDLVPFGIVERRQIRRRIKRQMRAYAVRSPF